VESSEIFQALVDLKNVCIRSIDKNLGVRVLESSGEIIHQIPYQSVFRPHGMPAASLLDVTTVAVTGLGDIAALVVTGDLQHRERRTRNDQRPARLLGELVAEELHALCELGILPPADETGVLLTGDLHCDPNLTRLGGIGDVRSVWEGFAENFAFVAGVAGNHDAFGPSSEWADFRHGAGRNYLDLEVKTLGALKIGGVGGIVGDPKRPNRRTNEAFLSAVDLLLLEAVDVLVLHDAPAIPEKSDHGNADLRSRLERGRPTFVACGHIHWTDPLTVLTSGTTVLNVDSRCVVLLNNPEIETIPA
jgi:Icc protein